MPEFVLHRTHTLRTTNGVCSFTKGEPTLVPAAMVADAIAIGAQRADGSEADNLPEEVKLPVPPVGDERLQTLYAAFSMIAERNDSKDFTGQGVPTVKVVTSVVGFEVDRAEVVEAWGTYKVAVAEAAE